MIGLLIVGVIVLVFLLYAADRLVKARARGRRLRMMGERLAVVTAKAEEQQEKRSAVAKASAELTSVMPAIHHPVLNSAKAGTKDEAAGAGSR